MTTKDEKEAEARQEITRLAEEIRRRLDKIHELNLDFGLLSDDQAEKLSNAYDFAIEARRYY